MSRLLRAAMLSAAVLLSPACNKNYQPPPGQIEAAPEAGQFPHALFTQVLATYVDDKGYVDFAGLVADQPEALQDYLRYVAEISPSSNPELFPTDDHALAYWINAYNALCMWALMQNPGMESLQPHLVKFFAVSKHKVGGEWLTLNDIEGNRIRKRFDDPRIHMVVVCYALSCPRLPQKAYDPENLQQELDDMSRELVHDEKYVTVEGDVNMVSRVFTWYEKDFEVRDGVNAFINSYGREVPLENKIDSLYYDWTVRAQEGKGL